MQRIIAAFVAAVAVLGLTAGPAVAQKKPAAPAEPAGTIVDVAVGASEPRRAGRATARTTTCSSPPCSRPGSPTTCRRHASSPSSRRTTGRSRSWSPTLTGADELPSEADALAAVLATFSVEQITEILLYHVTPGALDSAAVLARAR